MTDLTKEQIEELRGLAAKATPGPWDADFNDGEYGWQPRIAATDGRLLCVVGNAETERQDQWEADAALIVAMRNALPALLDLATASLAGASAGDEELCKRLEAPIRTVGTSSEDAWDVFDDLRLEAAFRLRSQAREIEALTEGSADKDDEIAMLRDSAARWIARLSVVRGLTGDRGKMMLADFTKWFSERWAALLSAESELAALRAERDRLREEADVALMFAQVDLEAASTIIETIQGEGSALGIRQTLERVSRARTALEGRDNG